MQCKLIFIVLRSVVKFLYYSKIEFENVKVLGTTAEEV